MGDTERKTDDSILRDLEDQERLRGERRTELEALGASADEVADILEPRDEAAWSAGDRRHTLQIRPDTPTATEQLRVIRDYRRWEADEERRLKRDALTAIGVPELHLQHVYDAEPKSTDAIAAVRAFLSSKDLFLVLSAGLGTGKTGAAAWALSRLRYRSYGLDGRFVRMAELRDLLRFGDEEQKRLIAARRCQLLVLDDLGADYRTDWLVAGVEDLIDARYGRAVQSIVTTNLDAAQFKATYPRAADRIRETGTFLTLAGQSMRRRKAS